MERKIHPLYDTAESMPQQEHVQTKESFRYINAVPLNPPRLTLDYNTIHTCEGQLKAAVLEDSTSNVVEVIAEGMGGVGKTCALKGLAVQDDVKDRFNDGLLFIQLGNNARIEDVQKFVVDIVRKTGGKNLSKELAGLETLQDIVDEAAVWFKSRSCLFLVDDVWRANGIDSSVLLCLKKLVNAKSRLVYTTRDKGISIEYRKRIRFDVKDRNLSRKILMRHAYGDEDVNLSDDNIRACEHILDVCSGHPLALAVAGGSVRRAAEFMSQSRKQFALARVAEQMCATEPRSKIEDSLVDVNQISGTENSSVMNIRNYENFYYGQITRVVDASLRVLLNQRHCLCVQLFAKLSVLQKQQKPPIAMLHKLWGFRNIAETRQTAQLFERVSLLQFFDEEHGEFFQLHDLILDIARDKGGVQPRTIVPSMLNRYMDWKRNQYRQWWECSDDGYIHDNVCRLLATGPYMKELLWLLQRPQWIIMRLQKGGMSAVESDVRNALPSLGRASQEVGSQWRHSVIINQASRMSHVFVLNNPCEAWFQMHGRLLMFARKCLWTKSFVEEMERCAPRPWAKSTVGFLEAAGGPLQHIVPCKAWVLQVAMTDEEMICVTSDGLGSYNVISGEQNFLRDIGSYKAFVIAGSRVVSYHTRTKSIHVRNLKDSRFVSIPLKEQGRLSDLDDDLDYVAFSSNGKRIAFGSRYGTPRVWDAESGAPVGTSFKGHTSDVTCLALSSDGKRMVSASQDDTIRVWDVESGEPVGARFEGHTGVVSFMAFSSDRKRIVSGSWDDAVRVWNSESGEPVGSSLKEHTGNVTCVAFSNDGKHILLKSKDKALRVWSTERGEPVGPSLRGHTGDVTFAAFSNDGKRIVLKSKGETLRVWNTESGEPVGPSLRGHTGDVTCVAFSSDGKRIVSGSWDGTVLVWSTAGEVPVGPYLKGHTDDVTCVAFSNDGKRIVSGSRDRTVRVWDAETGEHVNTPLKGHTDDVTCVAFSNDGKRIVSGSSDRTVCVWDTESGEPIGVAPKGYLYRIVCVAFSSESKRMVLEAHDDTVRIWDADSKEPVTAPLRGHIDGISCVALSSDGKLLVMGSRDKSVHMWNAESGEPVGAPLKGHTDEVTCVALSSDGKLIASGSSDGTVRAWCIEEGNITGTSLVHGRTITEVAVNGNGLHIVSIDFLGFGRLWDVASGECVCTSDDIQWNPEIKDLSLTWSRLLDMPSAKNVVTTATPDGEQTLATLPFEGYQFGKYFFKKSFEAKCDVEVQ